MNMRSPSHRNNHKHKVIETQGTGYSVSEGSISEDTESQIQMKDVDVKFENSGQTIK